MNSPELGLLPGGLFLQAPHLLLGLLQAPADDHVLAVHSLDGRLDTGVGRVLEESRALAEAQPLGGQALAQRIIDGLQLLRPLLPGRRRHGRLRPTRPGGGHRLFQVGSSVVEGLVQRSLQSSEPGGPAPPGEDVVESGDQLRPVVDQGAGVARPGGEMAGWAVLAGHGHMGSAQRPGQRHHCPGAGHDRLGPGYRRGQVEGVGHPQAQAGPVGMTWPVLGLVTPLLGLGSPGG